MILTVEQWRRAKGLSQAKMATILGIHINTYQNWEKNPENISVKNANEISHIFNVPIDDISFKKEAE